MLDVIGTAQLINRLYIPNKSTANKEVQMLCCALGQEPRLRKNCIVKGKHWLTLVQCLSNQLTQFTVLNGYI